MQSIKNQKEYIKYLEDYMFISEANRPTGGSSYKLPFLAESIKDYKERQRNLSPKMRVFVILFNTVLTSVLMSMVAIWNINEVLKIDVLFSFQNIVVVSCFFLIAQSKFRLFREF